jgi:Suppressor of fused protein (SUFU)
MRSPFHVLLLAGLLAFAANCTGEEGASSPKESSIEALKRHYETAWGPSSSITRWTKGPYWELPDSFRVAIFPPRSGREYWVYATMGMSLGDEDGLELHLRSPRPSDELVEILTVAAHFHRTGEKLGLYHSVNFGRPWLKGSLCDHGFITLPYPEGPRLEWLTAAGTKIRNLWLVPITKAERDYKKRHGTEALEQLLERSPGVVLDPSRKSLV